MRLYRNSPPCAASRAVGPALVVAVFMHVRVARVYVCLFTSFATTYKGNTLTHAQRRASSSASTAWYHDGRRMCVESL